MSSGHWPYEPSWKKGAAGPIPSNLTEMPSPPFRAVMRDEARLSAVTHARHSASTEADAWGKEAARACSARCFQPRGANVACEPSLGHTR